MDSDTVTAVEQVVSPYVDHQQRKAPSIGTGPIIFFSIEASFLLRWNPKTPTALKRLFAIHVAHSTRFENAKALINSMKHFDQHTFSLGLIIA